MTHFSITIFALRHAAIVLTTVYTAEKKNRQFRTEQWHMFSLMKARVCSDSLEYFVHLFAQYLCKVGVEKHITSRDESLTPHWYSDCFPSHWRTGLLPRTVQNVG